MLDKIRDVKAREVDKAKAITALKGILPYAVSYSWMVALLLVTA